MKRNAIIRIVIWSIAVVCLTAILLAGLGFRSYRSETNMSLRSDRTELAVTGPTHQDTISKTVTLGKKSTIYSSPSEDAAIAEELDASTEITIQRTENVGGNVWAYLDAPIQGWMLLERSATDAAPIQEPSAWTASVSKNAEVYSMPSADKGISSGTLKAGEQIQITRREQINGQEWAYTTSPIQGWILTEHLKLEEPPVTEPAAPQNDPKASAAEISGSSMPAENISAISIDWVSGNIHILSGGENRIVIEETAGNQPLVWKTKDGKLSIDFCEETLMNRFRLGAAPSKDLTITVPEDWICQDLEIDTASSKLHLQGMTIQNMEQDTASGQADLVNCTVGSLEIDTASGDVVFTGSLDILECDAASANVSAVLKNTPNRIEMNSASGNLGLTLPADTGFTVHMDGLKTGLASDFPTTQKNGAYVYGNGACRIEMETMSGYVNIHKGS